MSKGLAFCKVHTAYIYDRGGRQRIGALGQVTSIQWGRQRDDLSFATVVVEQASAACQAVLGQIRVNRHELVIFEGEKRRWEGPISLLSLTETGATIEARDVMHYAYFTAQHAGRRSWPVETVIARAKALITTEMARKELLTPPYNVVPHVRTFVSSGDARTAKRTRPYETTVFKDIDQMAIYSGLDYTVVGRSIILFDTHTVWGTTQPVTQADFMSDIILSEYGMGGATSSFAISFEGLVGTAVNNGDDPFYGEWEIIDGAYNEEGTEAPTQAALDSQADRNLNGKNPPPLVARVPQNATLSPDSSLRVDDLVPGIRIPLQARRMGRDLDQMQKLDSMRVTEKGGKVTVQVTMSPASASDEEGVEA